MFSDLSVSKVLIFFSQLSPVDPFHAVNSLLSHSNCYFLHPRVSWFFPFFFFQESTIPKFVDVAFLRHSSHVIITGQLFK